jgi:hypothetical protein
MREGGLASSIIISISSLMEIRQLDHKALSGKDRKVSYYLNCKLPYKTRKLDKNEITDVE